ncbi:MAG: prolyl-tRNA synthetase [Candidatus Kerfeldbacteria bacterium]|nr:prolyl-tRNA synthetase [Candidatus Kerfeldbacteria bacterium]
MRQSHLFTKTRKEAPADETSISAKLLIRAGFVFKEQAGVYSMLPLGVLVQNKIVAIVRQAMNAIGGQEVAMTSLQDPELWKTTDRWDDAKVDNWFKTKLKNDTEIGLAFTHEEALTRIMRNYVGSYRDLPKFVYQFQTKFRNELRAKSGLLRGREFLMKDLYSFTKDTADLEAFYERAAAAYTQIYATVGLGEVTHRTFASGGVFSKFSDEFQVVCDSGEDTIYLSSKGGMAVNKEVYTDDILAELGLQKSDMREVRAIEVGNIFKLGTKYSAPLGLTYTDEHGTAKPVVMGSYGIGVGRLLATIIEVHADDHGMIWPAAVAPFPVHLVRLGDDPKVSAAADNLVAALAKRGIEVLDDDREMSPGQKFTDSDLIGIPTRVVVSAKTLAAKKLEVKDRATGAVEMMTTPQLLKRLKA